MRNGCKATEIQRDMTAATSVLYITLLLDTQNLLGIATKLFLYAEIMTDCVSSGSENA